jgi:ribosomal protein S27E
MRLTLFDVARSMEELDGFSAEDRDRILQRARLREPGDFGCGCLVTFVVVGVVCTLVAPMLLAELGGSFAETLGALLVPFGLVIAWVVALYVRDQQLQGVVRAQIERVRCPACRASLMGASRSIDMARCAACGAVHGYADLGIEEEDLGPPLLHLNGRAACPRCGYSWAGLTAEDGVVRCPECGTSHEVVTSGPPRGTSVPWPGNQT